MLINLIFLLSMPVVTMSESNYSFLEKPECFPVSIELHTKEIFNKTFADKSRNDLILQCQEKRCVFQHLAFCLLPYLNIIADLNDIGELSKENFPKLRLTRCPSFFSQIDHWTKNMFERLYPLLGDFIEIADREIVSNSSSVIEVSQYDLDRNFTLRLSAYLNELDVCHEIKRVLEPSVEKNVNVLVIDRKKERKFDNIQEVIGVLNNTHNISSRLEYFETQNFSQQLDLVRSSDIIIAAHGAAITNTFALPLCGQLIEIFPYGYCVQYYFGKLKIDRHFIFADMNTKASDSCFKELNVTLNDPGKSNESLPLPEDFCHPAMQTLHGRICLRKAPINVDLKKLAIALQNAKEERLKCMKESNLFYTAFP